jgi:hypothetical protein
MEQKRKEALSFAGILKLLYSNRKTGILKVKSVEGELLVHFKEGKIIAVDTARGQDWIIGQYLTEGEVLSEKRLMKALKLSTQKGVTPEEILVKKRYLSPDVLKRYMDLYSREVILPLFSKVGLVCSFMAEEPSENRWLPAVSVPFLLKEGEKRAKEWPLFSKRIPSDNVVYAKDKSFIAQVVRDGDETGNPLFSDKLDPELGANERIVYYFVDGKKSVKQLARAAGLDLFSTYRALYNLENKFMVKLAASQVVEAPRDKSVIPAILRAVFYVILILAILGLAMNRPGPLKIASGERSIDVEQFLHAAARADMQRLRYAIQARYLERLDCPASLGDVVGEAGLSDFDLSTVNYVCRPAQGYRIDAAGGEKD